MEGDEQVKGLATMLDQIWRYFNSILHEVYSENVDASLN